METLPGGGPPNTFYDFVGPSPVNLWSSSEEYSVLRSVSRGGSFSLFKVTYSYCGVYSKTFRSLYGYQNQYRPRFHWITEVGEYFFDFNKIFVCTKCGG